MPSHQPDSGPPPESTALPAPAPADGALRVDVPEVERYPTVGVLGRGGMGRVTAVRDARLGRTVARKEALPGHEQRLVDEASLAARLEHPGIVSVLDAGRTADGRPFYTMTLGTGRTLYDALTERPTAAARRPLVRTVLLASEAVAHAHRRGVVHRDLKPTNLLLGELGEVQVSDWGLAAEVGAAGASEGTDGYVAPEQRAGAPADPRSDVWSLGRLLADVLRGADEDRFLLPSAPPELRAVVRRATATDPADRYPDAGALAADLAAWFDGDRVAAHDYSTLEQLARVVRAWRVPLSLVVVGLAAAGVATALSFADMRRARDAALAANERATAALADALAVEAASAESRGAWSDAAALAQRSLDTRPTAAARGVLASVAGAQTAPPVITPRRDDCVSTVPAADGSAWLCVGLSSLARWDVGRDTPTWTAAPAREAAWTRDLSLVLARSPDRDVDQVLDGTTGVVFASPATCQGQPWMIQGSGVAAALVCGGALALRDRSRSWTVPVACDFPVAASWSFDGRSLWVGCRDGRVLTGPASGPLSEWTRIDRALHDAEITALAAWPDGTLYVALFDGTLLRTGADGRAVRVESPSVGPVRQILGRPDRSWAALRGERGGIVVFDRVSGAVRHRLEEGLRGGLAALPDGSGLVAVSPTQVSRWSLDDVGPLVRVVADAGLGAGAWLDDGHRLAVAAGDGRVFVWDVDRGGAPTAYAWQPSVVKGLVAHDAGVIAAVTDGASLVRLADGVATPGPVVAQYGVRRLGRVGNGVWAASYNGPPVWVQDDVVQTLAMPRVLDGSDAPGRGHAVLFTEDALWKLDAHGAVERLPVSVGPDSGPVALADDGRVAVAEGRRLRVSSLGGEIELLLPAAVTDVVWGRGGHLAVGSRDGTLLVWDDVSRDRAPWLTHRAHADRIAWLAFSPDGRRIATASWDGSARVWTLP